MKKYSKIVKIAKEIRKNVQSKQKLGRSTKWSYYIAKAILNPNKDVEKIDIIKAFNPQQDKISQTVPKKKYLAIIKEYVEFVELNHRLPNYIIYDAKKVKPRVLTYVFAKILRYYNKYGKLPDSVNISYKVFLPPVTSNEVYDYFYKKTGKKYKTIDDLLAYIQKNGRYIYEYDDVRTNKQVIDCMCGNCTDWLQFLINMVEPMGYEWKCLHVQCSSGVGHVRGKFKHEEHTGGEWIYRDPASVANGGGITSNWCTTNYTLLAENPSWFLEGLKR